MKFKEAETLRNQILALQAFNIDLTQKIPRELMNMKDMINIQC